MQRLLNYVSCFFVRALGVVFLKQKTAFFFQAEDGIRDLVRSRGLGDVSKRQGQDHIEGPSCQGLYD